MEHAREHAKQDLERRTQEYFSASMQGKRTKTTPSLTKPMNVLIWLDKDLTQPEKNERETICRKSTR